MNNSHSIMLRQNFPNSNFIKIDYLLTECEVYMGKYLPKISVTDQATKEQGLCGKNRGKILYRTEQTNEVNKGLIIWRLVSFLHHF